MLYTQCLQIQTTKILTTLVLIIYLQLLFNSKVHYKSISKPLCFHIQDTPSLKIISLTVIMHGELASQFMLVTLNYLFEQTAT